MRHRVGEAKETKTKAEGRDRRMQAEDQSVSIEELIIDVHNLARKMAMFKDLPLDHEANMLRQLGDSLTRFQNAKRYNEQDCI